MDNSIIINELCDENDPFSCSWGDSEGYVRNCALVEGAGEVVANVASLLVIFGFDVLRVMISNGCFCSQ